MSNLKMRTEVPCLSTGCCLKYTQKHNENIAEITKYISVAEAVGASYIRFADSFSMNAAGKILKYKMREEAVEYLGLQDASKIVTA